MTESIHEYVVAGLQERKGRWPTVARESGVSLRTIEKVARRESKHPRIHIIEQLAEYIRQDEQRQQKAS